LTGWRRIYGRIAREFGWTYPEIDALPWPDLKEILATIGEWEGKPAPAEYAPEVHAGARVVTAEELERICASERAFADASGRR
jgi:hypothetical protein